MMPAIEIADLTFAYPSILPDQQPAPALAHINLNIESGQFVAVMGAVGAGKTTLCLTLNGLIPHATRGSFSGTVLVNGINTLHTPVAEMARQVGIVFQDVEIQLFNASVEDEIAFGLEGLGWKPAEIEKRIDWALASVGLRGFRKRAPRTLSGGEQKRLAIATVLAMAPPILVLDEPTAGLDPCSQAGVLEVIDRLATERRTTVVMATHDAELVAHYADRLLILEAGHIILDGQPAEVFARLVASGATSLDLPQLTVLAHLLGASHREPLPFGTPEQACLALRAWRDAERAAHD